MSARDIDFLRMDAPYANTADYIADCAAYMLGQLADDAAMPADAGEMERMYLTRRINAGINEAIPFFYIFKKLELTVQELFALTFCYILQEAPFHGLPAWCYESVAFDMRRIAMLSAAEEDRAALMLRLRAGEASKLLYHKEERIGGRLRVGEDCVALLTQGILQDAAQSVRSAYVVRERELAILMRWLDPKSKSPARVIQLCGQEGSGRRFLCEQALNAYGERLIFCDMDEAGEDGLRAALLSYRLMGGVLCVRSKAPSRIMWDWLILYRAPVLLLLTEETAHVKSAERLALKIELLPLSEKQRVAMFLALGREFGETLLLELGTKFQFRPGQILSALDEARTRIRLTGEEKDMRALLHRSCYHQVAHRLLEIASRVQPDYAFSDIILPKEEMRRMMDACERIRLRYHVFEEWGLQKIARYGRGLSILFAGPPGTGKTMGAQIIANALNMELYQIQLSQVVSKYIGETEKNLRMAFEEAKSGNCMLFFDECDALFGKRSEVKDAQDRYANVEIAYLLQQMEEHDGVTILATNRLQDVDAAFLRRFGYVIRFPFPDAAMRERLYKNMLHEGLPKEEGLDIPFLANAFPLSGGGIKNIVLQAAFFAAADNRRIHMGHLVRAAVEEMRKHDIIVVKEDLKEYGDLAFPE